MEVNNRPTSSPPDLSNDALPHSNLPTTTPPAVLGEKRKRKSGHKTKKPRKKQKKFIASDEEASEGSPSDTDSAHSSHGDGNDDGNDDESDDGNDDDAEPLPHSMRRRSNRGSASVAAAVLQDATSPVNVDSLPETISFASHTRLPSSCPDEPSLQPAAQPAHAVSSPVRSPQRTPPILTRPAITVDDSSIQPASTAPQPAHAVTSPVRSSQLTPPIITRQAISVDDSWPEWFVKAHEHLTGPDLGPAFDNIISKYITFEKLAGFLPERRNAGFGSKNRPSQVAWWVGCGRKATPKITDVPGFAKQWWLWWKGLQPTWRNVAATQGPLTPAHRTVANGEGGWVDMERRGQNAFYTVLATLRWWGAALEDTCKEDEEWLSAGVDVEWVLSNLLEK